VRHRWYSNTAITRAAEWTQAELQAVMSIYVRRGCKPKWKPISVELKELNQDGSLNASLAQKGLYRSNNAVMNKVKELNFKAEHDDTTLPVRIPHHL
jgi:hypothetical protein